MTWTARGRREGLIALRTIACLAALAGGLAWVSRLVLGEEPAVLFWVGLGLITVALAAAGASLVTKGTWWLRLVVAVALPALVLSIYSGIRPMSDTVAVDAVAGGLAMVLGLGCWLFAPRTVRSRGAHAR
jgi:hypothetical protein